MLDNIQEKHKAHPLPAFIFLAIITLAMFADILFSAGNMVLSQDGTDLTSQFIYWRDFGFSQLRQGNLALWNPHIFSGVPFFGGFQSALLYPPNFLYLVLPLKTAINTGIVLHVFLIGYFMYLWTAYRGLHFLACLLSSVLIMFSGSYFLHIYPGHLTNLCAMAWVPLVFLVIDHLVEHPSLRWCLAGIFTAAMAVLAGHPQYLYFTALAALIYTALCLITFDRRFLIVISLIAACLGAACLTAVQIFSGLDAARESVRSLGLSYQFASMFAFPPENLLTLLTPNFFGDMENFPYWGRCYLWEMSLFIGVTGITLAFYGIIYGHSKTRRFSLAMIIILLILALGVHTPLFKLLYHWLPGFDKFRGSSKFIFFLTIFLALLAAIGLDELIRNKYRGLKITIIILAAGILFWCSALWLFYFTDISPAHAGLWPKILNFISGTGESYLATNLYLNQNFVYESSRFAARSLTQAAVICLLLSLFFYLTKYNKIFIYLIALLAMAEIFIFAHNYRPVFDLQNKLKNDAAVFMREHPGDHRILNLSNPNSAMSTGAFDLWGYDQGVSRRYAQFMYFTQGQNPDLATPYLNFRKIHHLFPMIRCRYIITGQEGKTAVQEIPGALPRFSLITNWQVIAGRDDIFRQMDQTSFDPRKTVILEEAIPLTPTAPDKTGELFMENTSSDHATLSVNIKQPSILLITDSYSHGWKAAPLAGSVQHSYRIMPANYAIMAVPLAATGLHKIRLEYRPTTYIVGKWISLISAAAYLIIVLFSLRRRKAEWSLRRKRN